jgi:hypothetical protein
MPPLRAEMLIDRITSAGLNNLTAKTQPNDLPKGRRILAGPRTGRD